MIQRSVDELGRIVIPVEYREALHIQPGTDLSMELVGETIRVTRSEPACCICGRTAKGYIIEKKLVCEDCVRKIQWDK